MRLLVLHGPNFNLLGERPGAPKGSSLEDLNTLIRTKASAFGAEVRIYQSNHEGELVDALHAERRWADAVVVSPGALAPVAYALAEAIDLIGTPTYEVYLETPKKSPASALAKAVDARVLGKGFEGFSIAIAKLCEPKKAKKTLGKPAKPSRAESKAAAPAPTKTLGRTAPKPPAPRGLTRAQVRQKIAERLSGKLSPAALATWARTQWLEVQRGAPAESGQRELLEDSLQTLTLSALPASRLNEDQLIELMTQLEE